MSLRVSERDGEYSEELIKGSWLGKSEKRGSSNEWEKRGETYEEQKAKEV